MANFYGSSGNDTITGSGSNDYISGGDGNDTIYGLDGADLIMGGRGNDVILGGNGRDTIYGDPGDDTIRVTDASDYSTSAGDVIDGGEGTDYIYAETTNSSGSLCTIRLGQVSFVEWLVNTTNKTLTIEGAGYIDVSTIKFYSTAGGALGQIWGGSGNDTIKGFDFSWHSDTITGGSGNDSINGMAGNDYLLGMAGDDTLSGDAGNDTLTGYTGSDVFLFNYSLNQGSDRIQDYADGTDKIRFTNSGGAGFGDLVLTDIGADCRITLASGGSIVLAGVNAAALDAGDFIFA